MATFEQTRSMRSQQHFEVLEIDLPVITGACTIGSSSGYGTPLTCDQAWTGEYKTYKFTNQNAPLIQGSPFRCIKSISETATSIKPGQGLAGRGSLSITFDDFTNQDPNPDAPAVNATVKKQGTFFGKADQHINTGTAKFFPPHHLFVVGSVKHYSHTGPVGFFNQPQAVGIAVGDEEFY